VARAMINSNGMLHPSRRMERREPVSASSQRVSVLGPLQIFKRACTPGEAPRSLSRAWRRMPRSSAWRHRPAGAIPADPGDASSHNYARMLRERAFPDRDRARSSHHRTSLVGRVSCRSFSVVMSSSAIERNASQNGASHRRVSQPNRPRTRQEQSRTRLKSLHHT
jgi:hypothetical protein